MADKSFNVDYWKNTLCVLKGKIKKKDFIGFDVETYGDTNEFMSGGFYFYKDGKPVFEYFTNKDDMMDFILRREFRNKYVVATNLGFDISALFWNTKYWNKIRLVSRGSDVLMAKYDLGHNNGNISFIDTFNYAHFSVESLGSIIGSKKLDKPKWLGLRIPENSQEWYDLRVYNERDCKITCDFMYFLQDGFNELGGNLKVTIASTSLDIWRRNFQPVNITKENFVLKDDTIKAFIYKAFYGGRTEIFKRGLFNSKNDLDESFYKSYDVNSLYPDVMRKPYPLPQSVKKVNVPDISYILNYEGVSECEVVCPSGLNIPLLPVKYNSKLIFPSGTFRGVWNNVELRKALNLGYKVKVFKQIIYTELFYPFKLYVEKVYDKRLYYQSINSPLELVSKMCLNSLFGKFGQKVSQKMKICNVHDLDEKEFLKYALSDRDDFIVKNDVLLEVIKSEFDGIFSFPILSSYTTSYARLKMYDYISTHDVIYMDTDSVFTKDDVITSNKLGDMKLEYKIIEGVFVKPKFYRVKLDANEYKKKCDVNGDLIKIKGVTRCSLPEFESLVSGGGVSKMKFSKLKESVRRGIKPNTKINVTKIASIHDSKRVWNKYFDIDNIETSTPLIFNFVDGVNVCLNELKTEINIECDKLTGDKLTGDNIAQ